MKLTIIIVNYNVKYFLEQCLLSVLIACKGINSEIFVVDNNSVDGSAEMIRKKFPQVNLIVNSENTGFSRANNKALEQAAGEYILLLNPDTVVEEDTFEKTIRFMDGHPDAGGLGVKMIDGKGNFLPESKRALPIPSVAFYKIFGLSKLFPDSKIFGRYYLSYLDKDKTHKIDIISGAFMLIRKKTIDKTGPLDESFFMYGEDIDLSYRITQAGYSNYYFPEARIIHYKGESTKKGSLNYVILFYRAMAIFAGKHFSSGNAKLFSMIISFAIWFRAGISIIYRFASSAFLPLADTGMIFTGMFFIKNYWEQNIILAIGQYYPPEYMTIVAPSYIFLWLSGVYLSRGYRQPFHLKRIIRGIIIGTILILVVYSLLPESWRFSRAMILLGAAWTAASMSGMRLLMHQFNILGYSLYPGKKIRVVIIGDENEAVRVENLLKEARMLPDFVGYVHPNDAAEHAKQQFIGNANQLSEIIRVNKINEVIFCSKNLTAQQIIAHMSGFGKTSVSYKIAPSDSLFVIGSNSISSAGGLYPLDVGKYKI